VAPAPAEALIQAEDLKGEGAVDAASSLLY
jgi:hypothetical protein